MTSESVHGKCDTCGKAYRIPHAERVYHCKACGGKVHASETTAEHHEAEHLEHHHPQHHPHGHVEAHAAHGHAAHGHDPHAHHGHHHHHHHAKTRSMPSWVLILLITALVGGGGFGAFKVFAADDGKDLTASTARLAEAWTDGDIERIVRMHHPDKRPLFRDLLTTIRDNRKWKESFPAIDQQSCEIVEGTPEAPKRGVAVLRFGADWARFELQYEPSFEVWLIYALDVIPPPIKADIEAFKSAWGQSKIAALHPYMRDEARGKWSEFLERKFAEKKWTGAHPALGTPRVEGEEAARKMSATHARPRVESHFPLADGSTLQVNWAFHDPSDEWLVTGFELP